MYLPFIPDSGIELDAIVILKLLRRIKTNCRTFEAATLSFRYDFGVHRTTLRGNHHQLHRTLFLLCNCLLLSFSLQANLVSEAPKNV